MMYNDKLLKEARMVAEVAHSGQYYDNIFPYMKHLDDVVDVLRIFNFGNKYLIA